MKIVLLILVVSTTFIEMLFYTNGFKVREGFKKNNNGLVHKWGGWVVQEGAKSIKKKHAFKIHFRPK